MIKALSLLLARALTGARARWLTGGPSPVQRVYCANHTSHLDTVFLLAALPAEIPQPRPVAASDYWAAGSWRRFWAEHVFRTVFIERDRRHLNPLEPAFQALREGDSLIFFPEGTRGPGGGLQPLKPGLFYLARAFQHVEIVPVWIDSAHRILPKGAFLPLPAACAVTFGAPLRWNGEEDAAAFLARVRAGLEVARQHAERPVRRPAGAPAILTR